VTVPPRLDLSLYLVTDPRLAGARGVVGTVAAAVDGGVTIVQLRDPEAKTRALVETARALVALLRPRGIPLIVNDRVDVALAADADGVHVGQSDMAPADARRLIGPDRILGLSIPSPADLDGSDLAAVDYLGVGPLFAQATKADATPPIGLAGLAAIRARTPLPIVAIGGISAANGAATMRAGADGLSVVSAIMGAADPRQAARALAAIATGGR
jgi:thiamine-phosphate pyrophosphorylase